VQIKSIKSVVDERIDLREPYNKLLTEPGIGKVPGLTIMLETGPINRFAEVGNFVSYCRKVSTTWISNEKQKGKGNRKCGNKYLAWAFSEAAEMARRFDKDVRGYYNRKVQKTNRMVAYNALAHKLARAAYYIMRDGVPFVPEKCFG
jgi:transposase